MSRTDKDTRSYRTWLNRERGYPWRNDNAPSWWNALQRRQERRAAAQELANRREPHPKYHRPYYW